MEGPREHEEIGPEDKKWGVEETDVLEDIMRLGYLLDREGKLKELLKETER